MVRIFLKTFSLEIAVLVAMILTLLLAAITAYGQPLDSLPTPPGTALSLPPGAVQPEVIKPKPAFPNFAAVYPIQNPTVLFVGIAPRKIAGIVVAAEKAYIRSDGSDIRKGIFAIRANGYGDWLPVTASDQQIRLSLGSAVSRPAVPFEGGRQTADGDDGPWLPRAEQARVKAMWPKNVKFPQGLLFYDLPRRYQQLYTMSGGRDRIMSVQPLEDGSLDFELSGGMAHIPASGWNSVKGLAVPTGKRIRVHKEDADVRAYADVPRWRWTFPVGTVAVDALFADGKAFEIRTQTKGADGWETKIVYKDGAAAPDGFRGAGQACASCHNRPSQIVDVPGRIYMHVIWGDDGRFSWRPFTDDGTLDMRWPIEQK